MDNERNIKVFIMHNNGIKFSEIAKVVGVSRERVRQLYAKEYRKSVNSKNADCWWFGLNIHVINILKNLELNSKRDVLNAIKLGKLNPRPNGTKGYGWKSHKELFAWLGLPEPKKNKKICPHCGEEI